MVHRSQRVGSPLPRGLKGPSNVNAPVSGPKGCATQWANGSAPALCKALLKSGLNIMTNANDALKAHAEFFKNWPVKFAGPKPTGDELLTYHLLGARFGKQCLAGAMSLRAEGVTNSEIQVACGNPQLNKMRGFVDDALLKRDMSHGKRNGRDIYKHVVTPKGLLRSKQSEARLAKLEAAGQTDSDKPVKAKGKRVVKAKGAPKAKRAPKPSLPGQPASDQPKPFEHGDGHSAEGNGDNA